jgi:hypothetical protein
MSNAQVRAERRKYFDDAKAKVQELRTLSARTPPKWNQSSGQSDVDQLVWFDWVHADEPWSTVPAEAPTRPLPSRCGLFSELPSALN